MKRTQRNYLEATVEKDDIKKNLAHLEKIYYEIKKTRIHMKTKQVQKFYFNKIFKLNKETIQNLFAKLVEKISIQTINFIPNLKSLEGNFYNFNQRLIEVKENINIVLNCFIH